MTTLQQQQQQALSKQTNTLLVVRTSNISTHL